MMLFKAGVFNVEEGFFFMTAFIIVTLPPHWIFCKRNYFYHFEILKSNTFLSLENMIPDNFGSNNSLSGLMSIGD
jgi:hypothetical protein